MNPQIGEIVAEMQDLLDSGDPAKFRYIREWKDKLEALGGWQDISTAPKDGSEILGWRKDCGIILIRYTAPIDFCTDSECEALGDSAEQYDWFYADFICGGRLEGEEVPTHWQPLPAQPRQGDSNEG